jgi:multidrug efflux pump subunit AcrB
MHALINWWSRNRIAANFLMWALIALGVISWFRHRKEIFPEVSAEVISVTVLYPSATPEQVETGVCIPIEEAIATVDGIKRITGRAGENVGVVYAEVRSGYDIEEVLNRIKSRVDGIRNFAENAEKPVIEEIPIRLQTLSVAISADTDEKNLRTIAEQVRDTLQALPNVTQVDLAGVKKHEISIEVSEQTLRRHGITFDQVANAVRASSLDLPGGSIKTGAGEILIRTQARKYTAEKFEEIAVLTRPDGTRLMLRDVAKVVDGFEDIDLFTRFDGHPAVVVNVFRTGDEDTLEVAEAVKTWLKDAPKVLPEGVRLEVWNDLSLLLKGRLDLLLQDAWQGFILVYIMLSLFLRPALAFHVALGIPIAFAGGMIFLPLVDVSINMISLFAFIVVLGIVTDDAIVVGENIHARMERGEPAKLAAPRGTYEVMVVAIFGVFTVIVAFMPMLGVSGVGGKIWRNIPWVVIPTLLISLIETNFILPAHLSHLKPEKPLARMNVFVRFIVRIQRAMSRNVGRFVEKVYRPFLSFALRWRYAAVAAFLAALLTIIGLIKGNWIPFRFFPRVEAEIVSAKLTLPPGVPVQTTQQAIARIEAAAQKLNEEFKGLDGQPLIKHMLSTVGSQPFKVGFNPVGAADAANIGEVTIELLAASDRDVVADTVIARWRELTGPIPGAVELTFLANTSNSGNAIDILLRGKDTERLKQASDRIKQELASFAGVTDITDSNREGKRERRFDNLLPQGEAAGLSLMDVSRQVRQAFYGEEVQRLQRGRDEVKVMVRYPKEERVSLENLSSMKIRTPQGAEVPFTDVAAPAESRGYSFILRRDRERAITVSADIDKNVPGADPNVVVAALTREEWAPPQDGFSKFIASLGLWPKEEDAGILTKLKKDFPDIQWSFEGEQKDQRENLTEIAAGAVLALFGIYVLLAIPLRSYLQPGIVMSVIPFGMLGAVVGHIIMGVELSIMSMIGIVALSGVVVNESLVLVEFVNRNRRSGRGVLAAAREAGVARFQAIMLTSVVSFIGVMPIVTESSIQAKFLVPCAISLAFGCLSNLVNTLVLVPCVYSILEDIRGKLFTKEKRAQWEQEEKEEAAERGLNWMDPGEAPPADKPPQPAA